MGRRKYEGAKLCGEAEDGPSLKIADAYDVSIGIDARLSVRVCANGYDEAAKFAQHEAQKITNRINERNKQIDPKDLKGHHFYVFSGRAKRVEQVDANSPANKNCASALPRRKPARKGRRRTAR